MLFYQDALWHSWHAAISWFVRQGTIAGILIAALAAIVIWALTLTTPKLQRLLGGLPHAALQGIVLFTIGGVAAFLVAFAYFLIGYAPEQIKIRDQRIAALGGAPGAPVSVPYSLRGSNDSRALEAVGKLAEIMNRNAAAACHEAEAALACVQQIRSVKPSDCATKADKAFKDGRAVMEGLWTGANVGLLVAGDPQILGVLNQVIQPNDRQIFIDFDQYGLESFNDLYFLTLIDNPAERARLFEPALNLAHGFNRWSEATERYCGFINRANQRISKIRHQISR